MLLITLVIGEFQTILTPNRFYIQNDTDGVMVSTFGETAVAHASEFSLDSIKETAKGEIKPLGEADRIREVAKKKRFNNVEGLLRLAHCESRFHADSFNPYNNSNDRGIFQISRKWHPEVTDEQAFDVEKATEWTINMINKGQIHQWSCGWAFEDNNYKI